MGVCSSSSLQRNSFWTLKMHKKVMAQVCFLNQEQNIAYKRPCQGGGGGGPMLPVWILKRLVSVFINACRLLSALLSLLQFGRGWRVVVSCSDFILLAVATFWAMLLVRIYPGRASYKPWTFFCYGENCLMAGKSLFMTNALLKPYFIISVTVFNSCIE